LVTAQKDPTSLETVTTLRVEDLRNGGSAEGPSRISLGTGPDLRFPLSG
jgi:hypothetical protein